MEPGARGLELAATAKKIAAHPDRRAPRRPSRGSSVSAKYGAAGARGEARAGFPHVRRALEVLARARKAGTPEPYARLDALLTVMSTLQDTELLHTAGPHGLRHVQAGARGVIDAGGTTTDAGREALTALDTDLLERGWSPRGSGALLAGALFADALPMGAAQLGAAGSSAGAGCAVAHSPADEHTPPHRHALRKEAIHVSTSSERRGSAALRFRLPSSVTRMSSSIRTPIPRYSSGTVRSSAWK